MASVVAWARRRDGTALSLVVIAGLAWIVLSISGPDLHLHHGSVEAFRARPSTVIPFVGSWTIMTVAMMLPTTLPLVSLFERMTAGRGDARRLTGMLVLGYLATWAGIGGLAWAGILGVHAAAKELPMLRSHPSLGDAALLLVAGAFQFSTLKYRCLDQCRSPRSFLIAHWRGRRRTLDALELGLRHGLFCVGCCWALMLLMFAAGANDLVWMAGLGALMAVEKNTAWGRHLVAPTGALLLASGAATLAVALA